MLNSFIVELVSSSTHGVVYKKTDLRTGDSWYRLNLNEEWKQWSPSVEDLIVQLNKSPILA